MCLPADPILFVRHWLELNELTSSDIARYEAVTLRPQEVVSLVAKTLPQARRVSYIEFPTYVGAFDALLKLRCAREVSFAKLSVVQYV